MTISSWRLSSCEDPLLFEIPADTSQPKGDAIQAVHNFLGDLAQCGWAVSPSLPWRHSPAPGFPRLGTPCQSARPRWPQYGTCGPRWPPEAPMWAILRSSAPSVQSGPPLLFKPLETQISWQDIFNVVWLSSTTAPMFNHRPEDPSWVKSPDTQAMSTWTIQYNRPQLNSNREGQFIAEGCFISSTSSCFGELFNMIMNRVLNSFRYFPPLVKR